MSHRTESGCGKSTRNPISSPTLITTASGEEHTEPNPSTISHDALYCALPESEKIGITLAASFAAIISPFSTGIYYPSIDVLARDLKVSVSLINLTISTYQIFQGLAPSITAAFAETYGRRPAYLLCFAIWGCANLGLALQDSYPALLVLRCLQSSGSSGTTAIGQAVVSDLATRAERGKYIAYASIGVALPQLMTGHHILALTDFAGFTLGPPLGPVVGGLLSQYLGWRSIFWFLLILCGVMTLMTLLFLRETNRSIVGNGSVPPPKWNRSLVQVIHPLSLIPDETTLDKKHHKVDPTRAIRLLKNKVNLIVVLYGGLLYAGYVSVTAVLSSQLHARYGFSQVIIGLCYLPVGLGSLSSLFSTAKLIDWNFKREAKKHGITIVKNKQTDITNFDIERARLAVVFPLVLVGCGFILIYGWLMEYREPLAPILVVLFFLANLLTGVLVANSALLTDLDRESAASMGAAANGARCLLSAGGVAVTTPLINAIGIGFTSTLTAGLWLVLLAPLWSVYRHGFRWRTAKATTTELRDQADGNRH